MESKTIDELKQLVDKLRDASFTGVGTSKWYPQGSDTAYYRMAYSPARLVLRHKSPSGPIEERFEVSYFSADNYNIASVHIYAGEDLCKSYASEQELSEMCSVDNDGAARLLVVYLFNDPRVVLMATEAVRAIPPPDGFDKAYQVLVLRDPFGVTVICELFLKNGSLRMMRKKQFFGQNEITSQTMDISFQY